MSQQLQNGSFSIQKEQVSQKQDVKPWSLYLCGILLIVLLKQQNSGEYQLLFTWQNGQKIRIRVVYLQLIVQMMKQMMKQLIKDKVKVKDKDKQYELSLNKDNPFQIKLTSKITQQQPQLFEKLLKDILNAFYFALLGVGVIQQYSKYSLEMKKIEVEIKQKIQKLIKNNDAKDLREIEKQDNKPQNIIQLQKIQQISKPNQQQKEQTDQNNSKKLQKKGGFFLVQKKYCRFVTNGSTTQKNLGWKIPNEAKKNCYFEQKITRQIEIIKQVINKKYLLTYYYLKSTPSQLYMDYLPTTLRCYITQKELSLKNFFSIFQQLVQAVQILHNSKIVHRDLKPENILVDPKHKQMRIKIIDYAESTSTEEQYGNKQCGNTIPYSPFQCMLGTPQGYNKLQIDLWSIPLILYELMWKSIPFFYNKWIGRDIIQKWTSEEFSIFPIYRKRKGWLGIQTIISLITIRGIQIDQKQRLSLITYNKILASMLHFRGAAIDAFKILGKAYVR